MKPTKLDFTLGFAGWYFLKWKLHKSEKYIKKNDAYTTFAGDDIVNLENGLANSYIKSIIVINDNPAIDSEVY